MTFVDLFAGIGGFRYGLEGAGGYECVFSNELDTHASKIYKEHYGDCDTRDIRSIPAKSIPDHDLLCAGFPCQSFSVAGKRLGFEDTRGTLFFEVARIAKEKRPRYLLLENVKGLLGNEHGKTFQTILRVLSNLGYRVEWQLLNSKHFGVPQNRERVFVVGHLGGGSGRQIFPIRGEGNTAPKEITENANQGMRVYRTDAVSVTLTSKSGGWGAKTGLYAISSGRSTLPFRETQVSQTLRTSDKGDVRAVLTPDRMNKRQNGRRLKGSNEPAFCLTKTDRHGVLTKFGVRRLTPVECERLQGFPDGWTASVSDAARYRCLGNAVTTTVVTAIGKRLAEIEGGGKEWQKR